MLGSPTPSAVPWLYPSHTDHIRERLHASTCGAGTDAALQAHGETLTAAWRSVLGILEDAATRRDDSARVVRLGHEALELLVADFLAALPRPLLRRALHVEACFVMQAADVNTCYAASLSLWRAADTIGRVLAAHMHADASDLNVRFSPHPPLSCDVPMQTRHMRTFPSTRFD